jgi:hypothetical protein
MLRNPKVKGILVNIFGGIMRCDTIANGIVAAAKETRLSVPLVVRMKGTNEEQGRQILGDSGLPIISAENMPTPRQKIVTAVVGSKGRHVDPGQQGHEGHTQGITGKTGQFHTRMCRDYANGRAASLPASIRGRPARISKASRSTRRSRKRRPRPVQPYP